MSNFLAYAGVIAIVSCLITRGINIFCRAVGGKEDIL